MGPPALVALPPPERVAITTPAQWMHCAHSGTALDPITGEITLAALPDAPAPAASGPAPQAGLAVDTAWRVYRAIPEEGRVQRLRWSPDDVRRPVADAEDLLRGPVRPSFGAFAAARAPDPVAATALAVDDDGRMTVLDAPVLLVYDLATRALRRRVGLPVRPVDLAGGPDGVLVACADRERPLWRVDGRRAPEALPVPPAALEGVPADAVPARVAADPAGRIWLLYRRPSGEGWACPAADGRRSGPIGPLPDAGDLELDGEGALVVAHGPGGGFRRFALAAGADAEVGALRAARYDGRGIARTPDGRIAYWAGVRPRIAYAGPARYRTDGHVTTFVLDCGEFRRRWGRVYVDACVPEGCAVLVDAVVADRLPDGEVLPLTPPVNVVEPDPGERTPGPSLPDAVAAAALGPVHPLHRRDRPEQPWLAARPPSATHEGPGPDAPGRYLWLRLTLRGTSTATPHVAAVRVTTRAHDLLRRLPRVFGDEPRAASFLHRYLDMVDVLLSETGERADRRDLVLHPAAAPSEMLDWLASLVGLALDDRWPEAARRTLIAEAVPLFRARGTVGALRRMLRIYLGVDPVLVERFRFRGVESAPADGPAVLGGGFRVGGTLGGAEADPARPVPSAGAFDEHAHRFTVIVPGTLDDEQRATVAHLLDMHRPAHTLVDVCTAEAGMRVGIGLHIGVTSVVGPGGGFRPWRVGTTALGRDAVVGRPEGGIRVAASRLGADSRIGS